MADGDQTFFLALASNGKDAWNAWRRDPANKDVRVTFAGVDFSEPPRDRIDFSGFEFGDWAAFSVCKWRGVKWVEIKEDSHAFRPGRACFTGVVFGRGDYFTGSAFGDYAHFSHAAFGDDATFDGAAFGDFAWFNDATFDNSAHFTGAAFGVVSFTGASFGDWANFDGAVFGASAYFGGAAFGDMAMFNNTFFKVGVEFTGMSAGQWSRDLEARARWLDSNARKALEKRHEGSWTLYGSGADRFLSILFERARFDGEARFPGRTFERTADFTNAHFYYPPNFDAATNASRFDFTGAHVGFVRPGLLPHWTSRTEVLPRLRALRKIAEETKNHDLERDLYIEERKAERGVYLRQRWEALKKEGWKHWPRNIAWLATHLLWIVVMGVYWALADYGRSFVWPFLWLIVSGFFFYWRYLAVLAPLMAKASPTDFGRYTQAVRMLALGNAVPFVGPLTIDGEIKKFLFCPTGDCPSLVIPPEGYQLLVLGQNLFSITCVFFIGLALRNYFKIK